MFTSHRNIFMLQGWLRLILPRSTSNSRHTKVSLVSRDWIGPKPGTGSIQFSMRLRIVETIIGVVVVVVVVDVDVDVDVVEMIIGRNESRFFVDENSPEDRFFINILKRAFI